MYNDELGNFTYDQVDEYKYSFMAPRKPLF